MTLPKSSIAATITIIACVCKCLAVAVPPELPGVPSVLSVSNTSVSLRWQQWIAGVHVGDPVLLGYVVYYREAGSVTWMKYTRVDRLATNETVRGLSPDTDYSFSVALQSSTAGLGPRKVVNASTSCGVPRGVLSNITVHQASSPNELLITWEPPLSDFKRLDPNCRSGFTDATIYYCGPSAESGSELAVTVPANLPGGYYLVSLKAGSEYHVHMTLHNKDFEGPSSGVVSGTTATRPGQSTAIAAWVLFGITLVLLIAFIIFVLCYCERLN